MNIGVLTGGGDCPGLNAAIRAIARKADLNNHRVIGFHNAWEGLLHNEYAELTVESVRGILPRGGTILGTTRGSPFDTADGVQKLLNSFKHCNSTHSL